MTLLACRAILFDLDGVLVDSTRRVEEVWRLWAEERGVAPERVLEVAHGRRSLEVVRLVAPELDAESEATRLEAEDARGGKGIAIVPGATELLGSLPRGTWAVVTSGTNAVATGRLRWAGLPDPAVLVTADDVADGKPHPEGYLTAARLLGASPEDSVVVEDAPAGLEAAHAAGIRAVAVATTYEPDQLGDAEHVVGGLKDIRLHRMTRDENDAPTLELELNEIV